MQDHFDQLEEDHSTRFCHEWDCSLHAAILSELFEFFETLCQSSDPEMSARGQVLKQVLKEQVYSMPRGADVCVCVCVCVCF